MGKNYLVHSTTPNTNTNRRVTLDDETSHTHPTRLTHHIRISLCQRHTDTKKYGERYFIPYKGVQKVPDDLPGSMDGPQGHRDTANSGYLGGPPPG